MCVRSPERLANPCGVDDEHFDIRHHVHRAALPQPGTEEAQLAELVAPPAGRGALGGAARSGKAVVEGLCGTGVYLIVTKVHQAMVGRVQAARPGSGRALDVIPRVPEPPPDTWHPAPEPSQVELLAAQWSTPSAALARSWAAAVGVSDVRAPPWPRAADALGGLALAARTTTNPPPSARSTSRSPATPMRHDRHGPGELPTDPATTTPSVAPAADARPVHPRPAAPAAPVTSSPNGAAAEPTITINDVVLATLAGGLQRWLLAVGTRSADAAGPGPDERAGG